VARGSDREVLVAREQGRAARAQPLRAAHGRAQNALTVLYFARVAALTGVREESWPLAQPTPARVWLQDVLARYPQLAPLARLHLAVNQEHRPHDCMLTPGDEVALFDPVTGG